MATHIEYTPSSSPTGIQQTISFWMKRSELGTDQCVFEARQNSTNMSTIKFNTNDELQIYSENGGTTNVYVKTNRRFRDPNGWYHIVYAIDTSQGTASDRIKMYINGVQETSFSSSTYPSQNYDNFWYGIAQKQVIGRDNQGGGSEDFQGILSHFHYSRGYVYQASTFGSTDSTTGEWKITTSPSGVNYGATGWFILKDGNSVTDQSGNGNNFTVGSGTLTKTEDNPSNIFATLNPLVNYYANSTFSNGNNTVVTDASTYATTLSTLGMSSGKYYCEIKATNIYNGLARFGISGSEPSSNGFGNAADEYVFMANSGQKRNNNTTSSYSGVAWNSGDIIGIAVDLDNNYIYFSRNGSWINSGNPASGASGTNAAFSLGTPSTGFYHFGVNDADNAGGSSNTYDANFGNGFFGTTAITSAGSNGNGSLFEYDVPSGYYALNTKNINTYG